MGFGELPHAHYPQPPGTDQTPRPRLGADVSADPRGLGIEKSFAPASPQKPIGRPLVAFVLFDRTHFSALNLAKGLHACLRRTAKAM